MKPRFLFQVRGWVKSQIAGTETPLWNKESISLTFGNTMATSCKIKKITFFLLTGYLLCNRQFQQVKGLAGWVTGKLRLGEFAPAGFRRKSEVSVSFSFKPQLLDGGDKTVRSDKRGWNDRGTSTFNRGAARGKGGANSAKHRSTPSRGQSQPRARRDTGAEPRKSQSL